MERGINRECKDQKRRPKMWGLIIQVATMVGIGFAVGGAVSNRPVVQQIPRTIVQETSGSLTPFILTIAVLLAAVGYCAWSFRRKN